MGVRYNAVRIKSQRSLWASCSAKRNLNFNWRLFLAPPEVLDYVVIHELAHLVVMRHSKRFWSLVAKWCPEHKSRRRWLRENGRALMRRRRPDAFRLVLLDEKGVPIRSAEGEGHGAEHRAVEAGRVPVSVHGAQTDLPGR